MNKLGFVKILVIGIVVAVLATGGSFYVGFRFGQQDPKVITVKGITNLDDPDIRADFGVFWQAWEKLISQHINGDEITEQNLVYGAVAGLADSFNDPHTVFFPPPDAKKFEEDVTGRFGGIGAEIGIRDDQLMVIAPLKESPAEKAGLLPKDFILKVDDESTDGLDINEAVKKIRGEIGTAVTLTILRVGWETTKDITIIRDEIRVPTADWDIKDNLLHIRLYSFNENAPSQFQKALVEGLAKGVDGIVLDLRNNPGGFLEIAVDLAGLFLPKESLVVSEVFRDRPKTDFYARGNAALKDFPTVILVNGGSASASEILAGALRDVRGIKLIGEQTFGKGTVQTLEKLKDNSSLKITIAKWVTPAGHEIEKDGLTPDFEIKLTEEDITAGNDTQLSKAFEVLKEEVVASNQ
ncbi:MAG: S41 family peptidase [Candidatus Harrisonbacteria bacterium]|nr:S41 family peptidase [Candidatus Harrisonbacteria bacterium]